LGVHDEGASYRLSPRPWEPSWLPGNDGAALTAPLFAEERRRTYEEVPGDPYARVTGYTDFRCDAQREAVRAVLSVPDGSSVLINLPTGAGKSLCAQLPALLFSQQAGVSVVVVPTTALAIDQARAVQHYVPHHTAYVGGSSTLEQEQRQGIRKRVREGTQRVVFTSPEALLQSLKPSVYGATRQELLRLLVVDEAHMVEQWGDEFRSSFQELAGLRTDLRRHIPDGVQPFTTLLLTATLTESALDTLETLFGEPGPLTIVSAAQLRPEPSYWSVKVADERDQITAIGEALHHLPRPLILYFTEPSDAIACRQRLTTEGYARLDVLTGNTPNDARARVIDRWRNADTDIVVATSAFGLGVDQADVRAVVHATLPENVDRFYQEVGRGGRDGLASVSLVIYTDRDIGRARSMNRRKIIGIARGHERWSRMFEAGEALGGDRIRVPIDVRPNLADAIDMESDLNRAWNVRTLTLMSRARLLAFDAEPPPDSTSDLAAGGTEEEARQRYDRAVSEHQRHRVVRLRHHGTINRDVWVGQVEPVRQRTADADRRNYRLMSELLRGPRCVTDVLADAYTVPQRVGRCPRVGVTVARTCGGCEYCRTRGERRSPEPLPTILPRWKVAPMTGPLLDELRGDRAGMAIFYTELSSHRLTRILRWLVGQGVRVAVMPADVLTELRESLYQPLGSQWVFTYSLEGFYFLHAPALPAVVYAPAPNDIARHLQLAIDRAPDGSQPRVLLAPTATRDALAPHRLLRTSLGCRTYDLDEFSMRVGL